MKDSWISVRDQLPKLPEVPVCNIFVLACNEGDKKSRPMVYARRVNRGKSEELWLTARAEPTYKTPDYWQPLPMPPKGQKTTAKEREKHD